MRPLILCCLLAGLFFGCQKSFRVDNRDISDQVLVGEARAYFKQIQSNAPDRFHLNPRTTTWKSPDWDHAAVLQLAYARVVLVPVHYGRPLQLMSSAGGPELYALDQVTHLLLYQDSAHIFREELLTVLPDSNYTAKPDASFSGMILIDHWNGMPIARFKFDGNSALVYDLQTVPKIASTSYGFQVCTQVAGYNYSPDDPDGGQSWSEPENCMTYFLPSPAKFQNQFLRAEDYTFLGGGGGVTVPSPAASFQVLNGKNPIGNIQDYNKCFTNNPAADHLYQVTVCVEQPNPGTRDPWGFQSSNLSSSVNPFEVGHTFVVFSERYGETTIVRNIGFYPRDGVNPWSPTSPGQLDNNASSYYDVSLTITVNNLQFFNILNYVSLGNNPGFTYDLNSNNCTSFTLHALAAGDVNLPSTIGTWPNGSGNDPGDLGEDIRNMILQSNMTRSTVDNPHPNIGSCL